MTPFGNILLYKVNFVLVYQHTSVLYSLAFEIVDVAPCRRFFVLERVVDGDASLQASKNQNKQETNQAHDFAMLCFGKLICGPGKKRNTLGI